MKNEQILSDLNRIQSLFTSNKSDNDDLISEINELVNRVKSSVSALTPDQSKDYHFYKNIFEKAPVGIVSYDSFGIITACNDSLLDLLGSQHDKVVGLCLLDLPDKQIVKAVKKSLKGHKSTHEGFYTSVTSGKTVPVNAIFHPIQNASKEPVGGIGMIEDISDRYAAREDLIKSEVRYRSIFENKHKVMLIINPDTGFIVDANPAATQYYGWSIEELKKMKISDINTLTPDEIQEEMQKAKASKRNHFLFKHRLSDGSVRDVEVFSGMIELQGKILLYSIITDVTERLKNQKDLLKLKLGIERSKNIIFITDKDGFFQYVNPSFEKVYGYTFKELSGKTPRILKSGKQEDRFYRKFWDTILDGDVMTGEVINKTKEGELLTIDFSSNPILDNDGHLLGFIAIQDDITERKVMDIQIQQSLEEKELLLGEIHHRVKNNLAIISGLLEMNLYHTDDESIKEMVRANQLRIKSMAKIHEKLYESETFSNIPFREYVEEMIDEIEQIYKSPGLKLDINLEIEPLVLNINQAISCGFILNELVSNSLTHAFSGRSSGSISVSLKKVGNRLSMSVEDDGVGVDEQFNFEETNTLGITIIKISSMQLGADLEMFNTGDGLKTVLTFEINEKQKGSSGSLVN
ncbi:PAS domain S-box protein [Rhodohalobacter mucosus]|uniref:PAS domain S-box-containing protein n=1 Tax=Rhodohalobacter mucosus TaxID=2079485 RepID=A0A316TR20_9BACT|nr:PAS domain S-box protein [Rhodohalobacter mucosus]PWN06131.1 hypothetical protein DDZ15_09810 [Rhodohalobacter mucosus]